jgi:hypothetical protein
MLGWNRYIVVVACETMEMYHVMKIHPTCGQVLKGMMDSQAHDGAF